MKALLFFLLVPGAMGFYMATVAAQGPYQRYPGAAYAIAALGVLGLLWLVVKQRTVWRLVLLGMAILAAGLFTWWTLDYSDYGLPSEKMVAAVGAPLGQAAAGLKDSSGQAYDMAAALAAHEQTLLVFYRGYW